MTTDSSWDERNREFATSIVAKLRQRDFIAYFAGGCVRDQLMGFCPKDYDVATNASPEQIVQIFGSRNTHLVGAAFGVACVHQKKGEHSFQVEVATFRTDGEYVDGRRPTSVRYASPQDDAQRRDFTINGMFYDPIENQLHDFVQGEDDLKKQVIRAIGSPHQRFAEDKLRMVRAVRFAARFQFEIESGTEQALLDSSHSLSQISSERLADELSKISKLSTAAWALDSLHAHQLLGPIWPRVNQLWNENSKAKSLNLRIVERLGCSTIDSILASGIWTIRQYEPQLAVWVLAEEVGHHLRLSNEITDNVKYLSDNVDLILQANRRPWSALQPLVMHPKVADLVRLAHSIAKVECLGDDGLKSFEGRITQHADALNPPPLLTGNDLIKQGYRPGSNFKAILQTVRDYQLDGKLENKDDAIRFIIAEFPKLL
jgi:poly(A) polymerase